MNLSRLINYIGYEILYFLHKKKKKMKEIEIQTKVIQSSVRHYYYTLCPINICVNGEQVIRWSDKTEDQCM